MTMISIMLLLFYTFRWYTGYIITVETTRLSCNATNWQVLQKAFLTCNTMVLSTRKFSLARLSALSSVEQYYNTGIIIDYQLQIPLHFGSTMKTESCEYHFNLLTHGVSFIYRNQPSTILTYCNFMASVAKKSISAIVIIIVYVTK